MITYYGYTISPHQLETGEGFLICRNVPIARTGEQDYTGDEVGAPDKDIVKVFRPPEEVFSAAAVASFEGKPFTNDHPPVLLTPENATQYTVGHVQNVRRGTGEFADYLVADIHIHDAATINEIQSGKREISCGYECEYTDNGDGTLTQSNIRGNHVALVTEGRAGAKAAIMDSNKQMAVTTPPERKNKMSKHNALLNLFGLAANGRTAEEINRLAMDTAEALEAETPAADAEPDNEPIEPVADEDNDYQKRLFESIDGFGAKLDRLIELMAPKNEGDPEVAPEDEAAPVDPIEAALKEIEETAHDAMNEGDPETAPAEDADESEEAAVVPAEEMDSDEAEPAKGAEEEKPAEDCGAMDSATAKALLMAVRPVIAAITDDEQRKAVTDAVVAFVRKPAKANDAAKIAETVAKNAAANQTKKLDIDEIQALYDARNPHLKKGGN